MMGAPSDARSGAVDSAESSPVTLGYGEGECSIRRVGDREWYCDTHERPAEDCEAASDTERGDSQ